ncbi:MAG: UbiA family prenyltransferase [Thermoplasmatales archaeon]|nr:MAG: UbiA family prenyltransferase [Thermoplasmatales archaeon]
MPSIKNKTIHLLSSKSVIKWRDFPVYELISYLLMFASVPMLAYGIQQYNSEITRIIILTILTMYSGFFAALFWNDINDFDIDTIAHPNRLLPSKRIKTKKLFGIALIFSAFTFIFAILISILCLILVGAAALFVAFHNKYLKRIVKFPAYSEIFNPVQWTVVAIFGFIAIWTALPQSLEISFDILFFGNISMDSKAIQTMILLVLFTYFADNSHDIAEGIHDADADKMHGIKTYATSFGNENAVKISFIMFVISGIIGIFLFFVSILSPIFLIIFILLFVYTLPYPLKLLKSKKKNLKEQGSIVGRKLYDYFLFTYNLIFIDLLIQILTKS